jgi:two-component system, response regulator
MTDMVKTKLLLVEDSDDDAFFFERTLQKSELNCAVEHVFNGAEAIEYLRRAAESDPQLIPPVMFLDLKMPVLNGFEVLEWLGTQNAFKQMEVVVLSGSEHQKDRERAAELGAAVCLVKPVKVADLEVLLRNVCPKKPQGAPV